MSTCKACRLWSDEVDLLIEMEKRYGPDSRSSSQD